MNDLKKTILSLCLILTTIACHGQSSKIWTLDECISYAWDNNLQVKQQEIVHEQDINNLKQSKLSYIPNFSASMGQNFNWGRSVNIQELQIIENKLSMATSASISASTPLIDGLSTYYTVKSNAIQAEISELNIEKLKNDISLNITRAYLQLLLSKQVYDNAMLSYENIVAQKEQTARLVEAGNRPYSALLEIEAQVASEKVQVVNAVGNVETNTLALSQMLDLPYDEAFDIVSPNIDSLMSGYNALTVSDLYSTAKTLPQIKSAEYALDNSHVQLSMAKGALYPSISLSAGYGTFYSDAAEGAFKEQFIDNRNPSIGISLNIPIFNGYQAGTKVKNARLNVKNYEIELSTRHQELLKEIRSAITEANNCYERTIAAEQNMRAMDESFRMAIRKFESGAITSTDYITSKTNYLKAQSEYYQAKFQYIFQIKILDYYKGIPIKL
ncbi:MAG: TolC family protein [Bacteroidales bacterium]|nr:TolC family protein [Bacteroidales bacterium]